MTNNEIVKLMGQVVTVHMTAGRYHDWSNPDNVKAKVGYYTIKPRAGWVVGVRTMHLGEVRWCTYAESNVLYVSGTKRHLQVVFWPTMNPVLVPFDGFIMGGTPVSPWRLSADRWNEVKERREH